MFPFLSNSGYKYWLVAFKQIFHIILIILYSTKTIINRQSSIHCGIMSVDIMYLIKFNFMY